MSVEPSAVATRTAYVRGQRDDALPSALVRAVTVPEIKRHGLVIAAAAACLFGAGYLGSTLRDENRLEDANAAARAGDYRAAVDDAAKITRAPTLARALGVQAFALLELGDTDAALDAFSRAAKAAPNDAEIRRGWAIALQRAGRRAAAGRQFARAAALNPGLALPPGFRR
jgi:Flp pilus assembly protein TadD